MVNFASFPSQVEETTIVDLSHSTLISDAALTGMCTKDKSIEHAILTAPKIVNNWGKNFMIFLNMDDIIISFKKCP